MNNKNKKSDVDFQAFTIGLKFDDVKRQMNELAKFVRNNNGDADTIKQIQQAFAKLDELATTAQNVVRGE